jgi:hypothetical protein
LDSQLQTSQLLCGRGPSCWNYMRQHILTDTSSNSPLKYVRRKLR